MHYHAYCQAQLIFQQRCQKQFLHMLLKDEPWFAFTRYILRFSQKDCCPCKEHSGTSKTPQKVKMMALHRKQHN